MLLDFLKELENRRVDDEAAEAFESTVTTSNDDTRIAASENEVSADHTMGVVPDITATPKQVCGVCNEKEHKYKCPKCSVLYCGIVCFQQHNQGACSENFAKECVEEELKNQKSTMKQRNDMNEKLLRQFRGEETKEEEEEDKGGISVDRLEHLLAKVNLEPEDASSAYDDLNEEEKKDF